MEANWKHILEESDNVEKEEHKFKDLYSLQRFRTKYPILLTIKKLEHIHLHLPILLLEQVECQQHTQRK